MYHASVLALAATGLFQNLSPQLDTVCNIRHACFEHVTDKHYAETSKSPTAVADHRVEVSLIYDPTH
jgi:hypothetical protein